MSDSPMLVDCPFCGAVDMRSDENADVRMQIDPEGWLNGEGKRGPACIRCGATAPSAEVWNRRVQQSSVPALRVAPVLFELAAAFDAHWEIDAEFRNRFAKIDSSRFTWLNFSNVMSSATNAQQLKNLLSNLEYALEGVGICRSSAQLFLKLDAIAQELD